MTTAVNGDHSKWKHPRPSLSESLRPEALSDLTLPMPTIEGLERVIETGSMVNMLFYGPPGSGKTSAAKIFIHAIGGRTINPASAGRANLAKRVEECASGWNPNICFVDEANVISRRDQIVLPDIIDRRSSRCRFLFAATDIKKLIPALQSRLMEISFEVAPKDREEVQKRLIKRYENILPANGFGLDKVRIKQIIDAHLPDLRAIANNIEFEFG
jgi:replication-associated recombination protein RarA